MSDEDVNVKFGATVDGALAGVSQMTAALEAFGANVEGLTEPLKAFGEAALAAFAVEKIEAWIDKVVDAGVDLARMEAQTGETAQQINVLQFAAEGSDTQVALLSRTITQFARIAEESQGSTNAASRAFAALGINVQQQLASGKNMNDIFQMTVEKLGTMKDSLNKTAIEAILIGGRSTQLSLALKDLGTRYGEMDEAVTRSGVNVAGFADKARDTKEGMVESGQAVQGFSNNLFVIFKPAIDAAILGWRGFVEGMNQSMQYGGLLWGVLEGLSGGLLILETAAIAVGDVIKTVFQMLVTGLNAAMAEVGGAAEALWDIAQGKFHQAYQDIKAGNDDAVKTLKAGAKQIGDNQADTLENMKKEWKEYWADVTGEAQKGAKDVATANAGTIGPDPKQAMDQDIQAHKAMLGEEVADVGQNLQAKMALQQQYYDWLKSKYPQNAIALAEAGRSIAQTQDQEAKKSAASWNSFFGSFNSGIMGILHGSENWHQAMAKMFSNVVELGLKAIEKIVANWIGSEITKTAASNAGNAARTASDTAAAAAGIAVKKADDSTSVLTSAKTGAANAYASTAAIPIIGPVLAPAAAAVAFGAIAAFDSFETGTPYVPATGPYMLHEGEAVVPKQLNQQAGGGSGDVHFHVSAMDSRSVQHFFETHAQTIAKTVNKQYQRGNSAFGYPRT